MVLIVLAASSDDVISPSLTSPITRLMTLLKADGHCCATDVPHTGKLTPRGRLSVLSLNL